MIIQCPKCKKRQKVGDSDLISDEPTIPGWFMIHDENTADKVFELIVGDNVFGRKPGAGAGNHGIESDDTFLSRKHCGIQVIPNAKGKYDYLLQDLGSTNGTFMNAEPRQYNPKDIIYLQDDDLIQMGRTKFIFIEYQPGRTAQSIFDELQSTSFRQTILS